MIIFTFVVLFAVIGGLIGWAYDLRHETHPAQTIEVTVTRESLDRGDSAPSAMAVTPAGESIYLRGMWISGQKVDAYPTSNPNVYTPHPPASPSEVRFTRITLTGAFAGAFGAFVGLALEMAAALAAIDA